jgi:hypothetical protein
MYLYCHIWKNFCVCLLKTKVELSRSEKKLAIVTTQNFIMTKGDKIILS